MTAVEHVLDVDRPTASAPRDPVALTPEMSEVLRRCNAFASAATAVVLYGESGTGKTHLAEYIHQLSGRPGELHVFSVGTATASLAGDDFFGHVRGAFTGAVERRAGLLATAGGGTLLLDDLQNLEIDGQRQLLQVLDRGTFHPRGTDRIVAVACRFVFAMTEAPDVLMREGRLLADLRYRLRACHIRVPPLRERRAEIPLLARRALARCPVWTGLDGPTRLSDAALAVLADGEYPGNVRDLEGVVECAYLEARFAGAGAIGPEHLPEDLCPPLRYVRRGDRAANAAAVARAMQRARGKVRTAARLLGLSRSGLTAILGRGGKGQRENGKGRTRDGSA